MLIKEWEYKKFLENISNFKVILIHGPDRGKVDEKSTDICTQLNKISDMPVEQILVGNEQLHKSKNYLNELIYQKSFFSKFSIIKINIDLIKIEKDFINTLENIEQKKCNFIILESKYLPNSSVLINIFKNLNHFALITCYQNTNIKESILKHAKDYNLNLGEANLNYLSSKFGNDSMVTRSEIQKLALFADGKQISFDTILQCVGDNSVLSLFTLCDSIGVESINRVNYLYKKCISLGANYLIILKSLNRHIHILLNAKSKKIRDAKELKPLLHFSRFVQINKQLANIDTDTLRKCAKQFYYLEVNCKINPEISNLLIKKLLLNMSNY